MILSSLVNCIPVVKTFTCDIVVLNIEKPLLIGQELIVYSKSDKVNSKITKIHKITSSGGKTKLYSP
jgi:hypothetical protein